MDTYFGVSTRPNGGNHATRIGRYTGQKVQIVLINDPKYGVPPSDEDAAIALGLQRPRISKKSRSLPGEDYFNYSGKIKDLERTRIGKPIRGNEGELLLAGSDPVRPRVDEEALERALNKCVVEWPMYIGNVHNKELSELKPGILKYTRKYAEGENKWLYEYEIGDDVYQSRLPPNAYAVYPGHKLYYKSFEWKKVGDEFVRSHIACFPLSQKSKLEALNLL